MKKVFFIILAAILVFSTVSCAQTQVYGQEAKSDNNYNTSPNVSDKDLQTLVNGNNEFAYELYQQLISETDGNLFYSPYSLSLALAMTYAGADGQTKEQMADVLNFLLEDEELHAAFNKLAIELNSRDDLPAGSDAKGFRLSVVNAIWGQKDFQFISKFLDILAENYDAGIRLLDFINQSEESRITINDWISEQTNDKINDLIPEGALNADTRLVLTNAIYFKAAWLNQFNKKYTYDDIFYLLDGSTINVPMMHQTGTFRYTDGDGFIAVELPYDTRDLSMTIIVPDDGNFENFENSLTPELINIITANLSGINMELTMPKFEFESEFSVKDALTSLGITEAFSDFADFSGITDEADLCIGDVLHKAFVSVDEEGTEAAAASAVIMSVTSMPLAPIKVSIDSSFIFIIGDTETGTTLFVGRVLNPAE